VCDMVDRTSTRSRVDAVEANDKNFARIKILKTMCGRSRRDEEEQGVTRR